MWILYAMNIFAALKIYAGSWTPKDERNFTPEEIALVSNAEVVDSQFGTSVCFTMVTGGKTYIPTSQDSKASVGDPVDLTRAKLITLGRPGDDDITRIRV